MIKYFKYLFAILFIISIELAAQHKDNTIATVGNQKISEREFKLRYELVPHYTRDQFNEDSSKTDLINSIIAEKLLAQEAIKKGLNNTDYFKYSIQQMKDLFVRDALYKSKIDSKIQISQADIQKALDRRAKSLYVRIISAYDSTLIFNYFSQLQNNAPFDSIGKISDPVEYDSNKAPLKITYGQMQNDYVEDTLYSLHVGQFSSPVKTNGGWFIFKLVGIGSEVPPNANDPNFNRTITNVIRLRKSRIIGVKYLDNFYKGKGAAIDSALFLKLAEKISSVLNDKKRNHDFGRENKLFLDEGNILGILNDFGNNIDNEYIVHIEKNPINLKEYLYSLLVYPILINDPSFRSVAYNLMENLNKYIQYKFLAEEGLREGFQNTPDVAEDLKIWGDDYLAKMLKNKFRDSIHVTDEDVKNYFEKNKGLEKVDILEILNNNLDVIDTVFKELRAGKDFRELARKYTQRSWTKDNGGEFGYFPTSSFGVIGEVASKMKLNHVYGPVKTDSGYSVIKLIGRIIDTTNSENNFESEKNDIRNELLVKEFNQKFFKYIAKLGERTNISINEKELKSLKVLDIPMFTYRYIGFGGRITAMPFLDAWYDWVKYIDKKSNKVP